MSFDKELAQTFNDAPLENKQRKGSKKSLCEPWILFSFSAAICFTACNESITMITTAVGPLCIFYFISGNIIAGLIYFFNKSCQNYQSGGSFWNNQNVIVDGKLKIRNLCGYLAYCAVYLCIQNMAMLTMYCAKLAQINVGVIITIWSINPLFMALLDYLFFGQKLQYYHVIGTVAIVICTVVISLSGVIIKNDDVDVEE